jgi:hypothetical protein
MKKRCVAIACASMTFLSACAGVSVQDNVSFQDKIAGTGVIQLTAWARLRGEFMIYPDAESMNRPLKYPQCISGVFGNQAEIIKGPSAYDGKLVTLTGELLNYSDLPDEDRPILPRKMLSQSVVLDACLGPKVLLIKTMNLASNN